MLWLGMWENIKRWKTSVEQIDVIYCLKEEEKLAQEQFLEKILFVMTPPMSLFRISNQWKQFENTNTSFRRKRNKF